MLDCVGELFVECVCSNSSSLTSNSYNVYVNPNMEIINPSNNILDLYV